DGLFQAWLNGQQVMNYSGANLYVGQSCYLKIANYHTELGVPVSVVHSRVVMGHTQADVQIGSPPPPTVLVPNVVGQMQAAATSAIISAGLTLGTVTMQSSTTVAPGNVISQSPAAGTSVASGLAVNLVVSSGAPPPAPVPVPNVVGQTQAAATSAITGAGLTVGTVTMQSSTTVPSGNVIGQNPAAGAQSASGSAVDLVVSTGGGTSSGGGGGGASGGGGAFDSFTLAALLSSLIGGLWRARRIRDSVLRRETRGLRTSGNHQPAGGVGATSADVCLLRRVRVALCNRSSIGFSTSLYVTAANSSAKNVVAAANAIDSSPDDDATINLRHITRARCNEKTCVK
ncbi:MAG: PASTA domain-containing protein, partial [Gammaproteobacteria bacterium]